MTVLFILNDFYFDILNMISLSYNLAKPRNYFLFSGELFLCGDCEITLKKDTNVCSSPTTGYVSRRNSYTPMLTAALLTMAKK